MEGELHRYLKLRKVHKAINQLKGHVIVCGYGRNGKQACDQLRSHKQDFVAIESNPKIISEMRDTLVTRPDVLEFLDYITGGINIRLEEILYNNLSDRLKGKTIRELEIRNKTGANIIGFKTGDGEYVINPEPDTVMKPDAKLFVLGTQEQETKLIAILSS